MTQILVLGAIFTVVALVLHLVNLRAGRSRPGTDHVPVAEVDRANHLDGRPRPDPERPRRTIEATGITLEASVLTDQRFSTRRAEDVLANRVAPDFARAHRRGPRSLLVTAVHEGIIVATATGLILEHPRKQPILFAIGVHVDVEVHPPNSGGSLEHQVFSRLINVSVRSTRLESGAQVREHGVHQRG